MVAAASVATVIAALAIGAALRSRLGAVPDTPELCLNQMFEAMRAGDVAAYLNCFTGELHDQLQRAARDQTTGGFSDYLMQSVASIKGRAILQDRSEYSAPDRVRLVVDRVFEGRPWEYQAYRLRRAAGTWKIYAIDPVELHNPTMPYGTPAIPTAEIPAETNSSRTASH